MGTEDSKKYNIGLLMGVFDLFHVGHLRLIQRASACCRYLRVGVLSDDLVEKYKNRRPVIPLDERMEILSAIRGVDEVVPITDDPSRLQRERILGMGAAGIAQARFGHRLLPVYQGAKHHQHPQQDGTVKTGIRRRSAPAKQEQTEGDIIAGLVLPLPAAHTGRSGNRCSTERKEIPSAAVSLPAHPAG